MTGWPARSPLVAMLLLGGLFSGCFGGAGNEGEPASSSGIESTQEAAPPAQADGTSGAIDGLIQNENGAPIAKAFVILIGSRNSTTSDKAGRFTLSHVAPGAFTLRVDADTYRPLEAPIQVSAGNLTRVNVTLLPMVDRGSGFREHLHDFWGEDETKLLFEGPLNYGQSLASGGKQGNDVCLFHPTTQQPSTYSGACPAPIKILLPNGNIVYPGTSKLSIKVSWTSTYVPEVLFRFTPANETGFKRAPLVLKSGVEQSVNVEYPMTDHGHQVYSVWDLEIIPDIRFAGYRIFSQSDFNRRNVGPFQVSIVAHRGPVPAEPPHRMFWNQTNELVLADKLTKTVTGLPTNARAPTDVVCPASISCAILPDGVLVPPGTTRLRVTLDIEYGTAAAGPYFTAKSLAFRTARINPAEATFADLRVEAPQGSAMKRTWELKLEPADTDAFYQKKSLWAFFLANEGREREDRFINECFNFAGAGCGDSRYLLTIVAVNDDFVPDAKT